MAVYEEQSYSLESVDALLHKTLIKQEGNVLAAGTSHRLIEASETKCLGHGLGTKHPSTHIGNILDCLEVLAAPQNLDPPGDKVLGRRCPLCKGVASKG